VPLGIGSALTISEPGVYAVEYKVTANPPLATTNSGTLSFALLLNGALPLPGSVMGVSMSGDPAALGIGSVQEVSGQAVFTVNPADISFSAFGAALQLLYVGPAPTIPGSANIIPVLTSTPGFAGQSASIYIQKLSD
jgi:hypothetical protein